MKKHYLLGLFTMPLHSITAELVDLKKLIPSLTIELRYATENNFTKKKIYEHAQCYLQKDAALALIRVQASLEKKGVGLKIWDAYRPLSAQKKLWETVPDPRYVADPKKGSRHNRGCAVDVTLVDLKTGKELSMPSEFDDFSTKAHRIYTNLPNEIKKNVMLLEQEMQKEGFIGLHNEWWHFDYKEWQKFDLLNIDLDDVDKNVK